MIEFNVTGSLLPKNDFYLQWCYIYWWQVKMNLEIMVKEAMKGDELK